MALWLTRVKCNYASTQL